MNQKDERTSVALKVVNVRQTDTTGVFERLWNEPEYIMDQLMKTKWSS